MSETTPLLTTQQQEPRLEWRVVAAILSGTLAVFIAAADSTITSTLSSTISSEFGSLTLISWLGAGYLIGLAATQPLTGKLSDLFGRKPSFIAATIIFALGNLICASASSYTTIILGRVIAGIGGSGCTSISSFICSDQVPPRHRGIWHSTSIIAFTGGMGIGAVFGGAINDVMGWRGPFIIIAPIAICCGISMGIFLPKQAVDDASVRERLGRIDYGGSITLVSSLTLFLIYANSEEPLIALLPASGILMVLFITTELRWAREPIIPMTIFTTPTVLATCLCTGFMSMTLYTLMYYLPLYLQLRGNSTSATGLLLLPEPIGGGIGSLTVGLITSLTGKYSAPKVIQPLLIVLGAVGLSMLSLATPQFVPAICQFVYGFGYGGFLTTMMVTLLSAVPREMQARSTSAMLTFRSIGSTVGLSVAGVFFRSCLGSDVASTEESDNPVPMNGTGNHFQRENFDVTNIDSPNAVMYALHRTFQLAVLFAVCGFICALFIKSHKLGPSIDGEEDSTEYSRVNTTEEETT
ncbi:unnamed protein product [Penicillium salamii]|uniref:MFS-type drug efflux transporter P55 n=1 Tax=Penicillium salamii TaxID=1612424 RepID=A0A9W4JRT6_9EURO|nr:unnamed protein product [Penicillium salamii]